MGLSYQPGIPGSPVWPLTDTSAPAAALAGQGTLSAAGAVGASATLGGSGGITAEWTPVLTYSAGLCGPVVRPLTDGPATTGSSAALTGTGSITAAAEVIELETAALSGSGTVSAAGVSLPPVTFVIAAACGDSSTAGTKVTPAGWTVLHTVTAANGTDHTGDTVLAAACNVLQVSSTTVNATATSAEAISGQILGVMTQAPSPVPAGINPDWPYLVCEAAFGSGYQTPPDEMTWVNLQTIASGRRCRKWEETTGIQYELDALESSELDLILDNPDGALSPGNPSSPYYPYVVPGTPVRLRAVPPASAGTDAWLVIQRNMERWPQSWDDCYRGLVNATGNDGWSVVRRQLPTCYRAEVEADRPYAWWPCDDPLITPLPVQLVNAAPCNSNHLQIVTAPDGLSYSGTIPTFPLTYVIYSAAETFAANSGWMYGDPVSAAWQQAGNGESAHGRYLYCEDPDFPPLTGGATIEGWWNLAFASTGSGTTPGPVGQPPGTLVLWEIASSTGAVATLSVSSAGALQLTIGGATQAIYGGDVRNATWFTVAVTMTTTSWQAWVNGGVIATASGTFGAIAGTWQHFLANGGTGTAGAPPTSGTFTGCANVQVSHLAVYPRVLPAARVTAHAMAAYAAFGQLPAPTVAAAFTGVPFGGGQYAYAPDGHTYDGQFFAPPTILAGNSALAAVVTSTGGGYSSSPSAPEMIFLVPSSETEDGFIWLSVTGAAAPEYQFFTSGGAGDEQSASVTANSYLFCDAFGSGAAAPSTASALGDTAQNRIERLLGAGNVQAPRCIDASPSAIVAELDTGGQACGTAVSTVASSDGGLLFMDNVASLCYFSRPHLAAMTPVWILGEDVNGGEIPYLSDATWDTDPQQVKNDIEVTQYAVAPGESSGGGGTSTGSAEATSGLTYGPDATRQAAVLASQAQNGDCQYQEQSLLQSTTGIQARSNWLFDVFGVPNQRITNLAVDAAPMSDTCPQSWLMVLGANIGDIVQATRRPPGQPSFTGQWRITRMQRTINFAAGVASISIAADVLPAYYPA